MPTEIPLTWSWNMDVEDACKLRDYDRAWQLWQAGLNAIEKKIPLEIPTLDAQIHEELYRRYPMEMKLRHPITSPWGPSPGLLVKTCIDLIDHCVMDAPVFQSDVQRLPQPTAEGKFLDEANQKAWKKRLGHHRIKDSVWETLFENKFLDGELGTGIDRFKTCCQRTLFSQGNSTIRNGHFARFLAQSPARMEAWGETLCEIPFSPFAIPTRMEMLCLPVIGAALRRRCQTSPKKLAMWDETIQGMATLQEFARLRMAVAQAKIDGLSQNQFDKNEFDLEEYDTLTYTEFASLRGIAHSSLAFPHRGSAEHWRAYQRLLPEKALGLALFHVGLQGTRMAQSKDFLGSYKSLLYYSLAPTSQRSTQVPAILPVPAHDLPHTLASVVATHAWVLQPHEPQEELIEYTREIIEKGKTTQASFYMGRFKKDPAAFFYALQVAFRQRLDRMNEVQMNHSKGM